MKRFVVLLCVVGLSLLAPGCEKSDEVEDARAYDPAIDGASPSLPTATANPDEALKAAATDVVETEGVAADAPLAVAGESATDEIDAAKAVLAEMIAAAKAGDERRVIAVFGEKDRPLASDLLVKGKDLPEKIEIFKGLVSEKLGAEVPSSVARGLEEAAMRSGATFMESRGQLSVDEFKLTVVGDDIHAADPNGATMVMKKVGGKWKLELDEQTRSTFGSMIAMQDGVKKILEELTLAINAGTVSKDSLAEKFETLSEKYASAREGPSESVAGPVDLSPESPPAAPDKAVPDKAAQPEPKAEMVEDLEKGKTYLVPMPVAVKIPPPSGDPSRVQISHMDAGAKIKVLGWDDRYGYKVEATSAEGEVIGVVYIGVVQLDTSKLTPEE